MLVCWSSFCWTEVHVLMKQRASQLTIHIDCDHNHIKDNIFVNEWALLRWCMTPMVETGKHHLHCVTRRTRCVVLLTEQKTRKTEGIFGSSSIPSPTTKGIAGRCRWNRIVRTRGPTLSCASEDTLPYYHWLTELRRAWRTQRKEING